MVLVLSPNKTAANPCVKQKALPSDQYALQSEVKFRRCSIDSIRVPHLSDTKFDMKTFKAIETIKIHWLLIMIGGVELFQRTSI